MKNGLFQHIQTVFQGIKRLEVYVYGTKRLRTFEIKIKKSKCSAVDDLIKTFAMVTLLRSDGTFTQIGWELQ